MKHQKHQRRRAQTISSQVVIKIQPGQKLLWQKNPHEFGFDLNLVDASTQGSGPAYSGVRK